MLYIRDDNYLEANRYVEVVDEGNNVLTLRLYGVDNGDSLFWDEKTIDLKTLFKAYNFYAFYLTTNYQGQAVFSEALDYNNVSRSRDEIYFQNYYTISQTRPLAVIYFHTSVDENVVIINAAVKTAMTNQVVKDNPAPQLVLAQYPDLQKKMNIWECRKNMMNALDPNNSLAYIEIQLDAVTKALFAVLDANPSLMSAVTLAFPEFSSFESELSNASVFTVKTPANCLSEITKTKTKVRQLQAEYYAMKRQNQT